MPKAHIPEEILKKASAGAEAIYRLTGQAGFDSVLKSELRKAGLEVLALLQKIEFGSDAFEPQDRIQVLAASIREFLSFGCRLGYVSEKNRSLVSGCFESISAAVRELAAEASRSDRIPRAPGQAAPVPDEPDPAPSPLSSGEIRLVLSDRQRKIMAFLGRGAAQIGEIREFIGTDASEKTIQRDIWQLINYGIIRKEGDYRWTVYFLAPEHLLSVPQSEI